MPWSEAQQRAARTVASGSWPGRKAEPRVTLRDVLAALGLTSSPLDQLPREAQGVRPDFGLTGAGLGMERRHPGEFLPGEATVEDVQGGLANIINSAGVENIPSIGPHKTEMRAPGRVRPGHEAEFNEWFGKSKVVTETGEPLTVYKGMYPYDWTKETASDKGPVLNVIRRSTEFPAFNHGEPGVRLAGFFSDSPTVASHFAEGGSKSGAVYPAHLRLEKPYVIDAAGKNAGEVQFGPGGSEFRTAIRSGKYDGVIIKNTKDEGNIYIPLDATQIKSATGNRGTYSRESADIRE